MAVVALGFSILLTGCDAPIGRFSSNEVFAKRLELTDDIPLDEPLTDSSDLLTEWFGTPDDPRWPDFLRESNGESLVQMDRLVQAAGAFSSDEAGSHVGLYREHCVVCHGLTGDGLGPSAALLNPYPRDYRMGKFKFTSTPIGVRPSRDDLLRTLKRGIVGTSMPAFNLLPEDELEALVDYVIYFSVRGEAERRLLAEAALELDVEGGDRLWDSKLATRDPDAYAERQEELVEVVGAIVEKWKVAPAKVSPIPEYPYGDSEESELAESAARGHELFSGTTAGCSFCHGSEGLGDGQQNNYDDWTRDWTSLAGINPKDEDALKPMLDLGALKPRNILPRNLQRGVFRGGSDPQDLYSRIMHGIEGTPMPAAPLKPANPQGLSESEVWDLVNFLLSLSDGGSKS
ncbi:MAG: cytochrome c [Pirellulaceae bacterium]